MSHTNKNTAIIAKRPVVGTPIKVKDLSKVIKAFLFKDPKKVDKPYKM